MSAFVGAPPDKRLPTGTLIDTGIEAEEFEHDAVLASGEGVACASNPDPSVSGDHADPSKPIAVIEKREALELGRVFGRYVVLQRVGSGGAGTVYAAYDPELDRKVALKVLNDPRPRARQRLLREAQAIAKVTHPNIVAVHDAGTWEGRVYIAMEFVDGVTLRQWLSAETRSWAAIVTKLAEAGRGLVAAHDAGLVHRDFKPENVLVEHGGRPVVLDFGLARRAAPTEDSRQSDEDLHIESMLRTPRHTPLDINITGAGALMGTPAYMAPEQHLRQRVDARTDQFSFCVVAWEALFGERPFSGESAAETGRSATRGEISEPHRASAAPVWLRRVLEVGLSPKAEARHPDMRTLLAALKRDPWRGRRRVAAIAGAVGLVAAGGWLLTRADDDQGRCEGGPQRWAGIWDEPRRLRIEESFRDTGALYAAQAYEAVASALDGYVDRWNTLHREACEATHVHELQPASALELQWACLGRRRGEVAALTDELIVADADVVEHAVEAVRQLRRLDGCADIQALGRQPALPTDAISRERIEQLRGRLTDAGAKAQAARWELAIEILDDVAEQSSRDGANALLAESKLQLAAVLEAMGRFGEAREALLAAIWAGEPAGHDEVVAAAWTRLVWVAGVELVDGNGPLWVEFAEAAVVRAGNPPRLRAQLEHNRGGVAYRSGRLEQALVHYEDALTAQQTLLGLEHPKIATTHNHIANALMELQRYDEAEQSIVTSLDLRERVLGSFHPKVAASLNNLGELRRKQGRHEDSLVAAQNALAVVANSGGPEELIAQTLVGEAYVHAKRWREAKIAWQAVIELREEIYGPEHASLAGALRTLARTQEQLGETEAAKKLLGRAYAIEAKSAGEH